MGCIISRNTNLLFLRVVRCVTREEIAGKGESLFLGNHAWWGIIIVVYILLLIQDHRSSQKRKAYMMHPVTNIIVFEEYCILLIPYNSWLPTVFGQYHKISMAQREPSREWNECSRCKRWPPWYKHTLTASFYSTVSPYCSSCSQ